MTTTMNEAVDTTRETIQMVMAGLTRAMTTSENDHETYEGCILTEISDELEGQINLLKGLRNYIRTIEVE